MTGCPGPGGRTNVGRIHPLRKAVKKPVLSIAIITLNEGKKIGRCLGSLTFQGKTFSRLETIVVDARSSDQTVAVAKSIGAKTFIRAWKGYADQKNWALSHCSGDWIFSLDADEELTPELIAEIEKQVPMTPADVDGYILKRRAFFLGRWIRHCSWWPDAQRRLIRRGSGAFTEQTGARGLGGEGKNPGTG